MLLLIKCATKVVFLSKIYCFQIILFLLLTLKGREVILESQVFSLLCIPSMISEQRKFNKNKQTNKMTGFGVWSLILCYCGGFKHSPQIL